MNKRWTSKNIEDQTGKVSIVTGANSGIGYETARALLGKGAIVIMACRNPERGNKATQKLQEEFPQGQIDFMQLDLSDLSSVKTFASQFNNKHDKLDLLVNNAGVMVPPFTRTADGFELQFGTNHLGHFALTALLLEALKKSEQARVVNVSSMAHHMGQIDFNDLNYQKKRYSPWKAYGQSKLANLLFTLELQKRFTKNNLKIEAMSAHPGWTATNLQQNAFSARLFNPVFAQNTEWGALPTLYAATGPEAKGGDYFGPSGIFEIKGYPKKVGSAKKALDQEVASKLWQVSEELTGVQFSDLPA